MNAHIINEIALNPQRRLWTYKEFERAGMLGLFGSEERLELIEGEIIRKVAPQLTLHAVAIGLVDNELTRVCPPDCHIRIQLPMHLGSKSGPEPDVAVVSGSIRDYVKAHPTTAELIVEVADSSLLLDRGTKASLYARAGVREYWIVDVNSRVIEVYREPGPSADQPVGHHYRSITRYAADECVTCLLAPDASISVADLLP